MTKITEQRLALKNMSVALYETSDPSHPYEVKLKNHGGLVLTMSKHENADDAQEEFRAIAALYGVAA